MASQLADTPKQYLAAAHSILVTLEHEVRQIGFRSAETAADALSLRATELKAQIARLEVETRNSALEKKLGAARGAQTPSTAAATAKAERIAAMSELKGRLQQAETDVKAYKARLRQQDSQLEKLGGLMQREAELEKQVLAAEGARLVHGREAEELRRRAITAEAMQDALRDEIGREDAERFALARREGELVQRVAELERQNQALQLEKATAERRAEICEAELVDTLAKVYTLQARHASGEVASALSDADVRRLDSCLEQAVEYSHLAPSPEWRATPWLAELGLHEPLARALLFRLHARHARGGGDGAAAAADAGGESGWLERGFLAALGRTGGKALLRSLLLETPLVDRLVDPIWDAMQGLIEEDLAAGSPSRQPADFLDATFGGRSGEDGGAGGVGVEASGGRASGSQWRETDGATFGDVSLRMALRADSGAVPSPSRSSAPPEGPSADFGFQPLYEPLRPISNGAGAAAAERGGGGGGVAPKQPFSPPVSASPRGRVSFDDPVQHAVNAAQELSSQSHQREAARPRRTQRKLEMDPAVGTFPSGAEMGQLTRPVALHQIETPGSGAYSPAIRAAADVAGV